MDTIVFVLDRPFVFILLSVFFLIGSVISNFIDPNKRLPIHKIFLIWGVLCGALLIFLLIKLMIIEKKQDWHMLLAPITFFIGMILYFAGRLFRLS